MNLLTERVAIITGASKGIGRVMCQLFAREGARVACVARTAALVEETADLVRQAGGDAIAIVADVSRQADVEGVVDETVHAFGTITSLVNNAGDSGPTKPIQDYTSDEWFYTINSSLTSAYLCTRFAVPFMIEARGAAIVNISSMAGKRGLPYRAGYCSAKAGLFGLTSGMALELGPHDITVNAIAPGAVSGDRIERVVSAQARQRGVPVDAMRQAFVDRAPLRRMSSPEDVASLAAFLCSDLARNISGQCIAVTAGEPAS
jgi:NAD(P)-dependent dehydrogenase (short-subunit alcohol dehydrogenase family)